MEGRVEERRGMQKPKVGGDVEVKVMGMVGGLAWNPTVFTRDASISKYKQ